MSSEQPLASNLKRGYKLCYYKQQNGRVREAIAEIELLSSSKFIDERQHEIYDFLKTDIVKITKIENLEGSKVDEAYLVKKPELKYDFKVGEIVRFKHCEFKEIIPDFSYIAFYTTKAGALNDSVEIKNNYTGTKMQYYKNGKIKEKHYYVAGSKTHTFGYYNNDFNSLHYSWSFEQYPNQAFPTIREYIYNQHENPVAQYVINDGKISNKTIYDRTAYVDSIYLPHQKENRTK